MPKVPVVLPAVLILGSVHAHAARNPDPGVRAPRAFDVSAAASVVNVDGILNEPAWEDATVIGVGYEYSPRQNAVPPERTECLVTFDQDRLYVAFRAFDRDPDAIRAHLADRDTAYQDDTVGFMIDPFNDERRAFEFRVNAVGAQMDAVFSDLDRTHDPSWDAIWHARTRLQPDGWVAEIAIPFSSLRFPRTAEAQTWGFMAIRDLPRSQRHRLRSTFTDPSKACIVCQFDKVTGFQGMAPGLNLEADPTLTASRTDRGRNDAGGLRPGELDADPGLTVRWGMSPNLVLGAAANPDFSQVEADVAQLEVNTRFALFFPEKRPLFLEGADFFSTPVEAVFTRTVADPDWGLKLTGKEGRNAVGFLVARDAATNLLVPGTQASSIDFLNGPSTTGVLRYRRDVGHTSTVGVLVTGRQADGYHNRTAGVDGVWRMSGADVVRLQYLRSWTEYPDALALSHAQPRGEFTGNSYSAEYVHETRDWYGQARAGSFSTGFRADTGFVPRVGIRSYYASLSRTFWDGGWFSQLSVGLGLERNEDTAGGLLEQGLGAAMVYHGPRQTNLTYNPVVRRESYRDIPHDNVRHTLIIDSRPVGGVFLSLSGTAGETIDFDNARQARIAELVPRVELQLARRLTGSLAHTFRRLTVPGGRLFTANLTEARLGYHFGVRAFLRAIVQYTDVRRDTGLYLVPADPRTRRLFSQWLFSYTLNPQTVVLAGYADNYLPDLGLDASLRQTDRTFFLKLGYAWVR